MKKTKIGVLTVEEGAFAQKFGCFLETKNKSFKILTANSGALAIIVKMRKVGERRVNETLKID